MDSYKVTPMTGGRKKYTKNVNDIKIEIFVWDDGTSYVVTTDKSVAVANFPQSTAANVSDDFGSLEEAIAYVKDKLKLC